LRNVVHFLVTGPSLVLLSLVQLWSYVYLALVGKVACVHQVAGKATLGGPATPASTGTDQHSII
jgi:hypothetical protein